MSDALSQRKTILVTGGAGFIGSHLCERLVAKGHRVLSLDNYFTGLTENHIPGVVYRTGHTKDIEQHVPERVELVYHLGEYARVERSLVDPPHLVWDLNIAGTFAVLEYCRKHMTKIVYAGSSTKYGDGGLGRVATPYAWTKATNTELVCNYGMWYGLPFAITYFYNVYGPRERTGTYGTVVAIFCEKMLRHEPLPVTAPGTQLRNFTYVSDIVDGLLLVGERGEGDEYGLGNPRPYSVLEFAKLLGGEIHMQPEKAGNRQTTALDLTKSKLLGWEPRVSLEEGLQRTLAYFRTKGKV